MQKFRFTGSFIISFVLNLVLNLEWAVLAFVLFLLHKFVKLPLWPCLAALGIWAGGVLIITLVLYLIGPWGSGAEPAEPVNKNPYSAGAAVGADSARTGDTSKPVQYKSELARAIMQPPAYDQLEESKVQELSDKDH